MRLRLVYLALALALPLAPEQAFAQPARGDAKDLTRARVLDRQGVRAFRDGRYNDAILYFEEAFKLGAPSSELWNLARCYLKLDDPEHAAQTIELYLAQPDLLPQDRAEAKGQLDELGRRHSTLTIASSPTGAHVAVDGKRAAGRTPLSVDLAPGPHTVAVEREGSPPYVQNVEAKYGRSVIIDARLGQSDDGGAGAAGEGGLSGEGHVRRFSATAELGGLWARLGAFPGPLHPAALLVASYAPYDAGRIVIAVGLRATITGDTWGNGVGAPSPASCSVPTDESATSVSAFATGALGYRATSRLRLGGDFGLGAAFYTPTIAGGDVFTPTCNAPLGVRPALHVGGQLSFAFAPAVRGLVSPLVIELQPAFGGTRTAPIDTSGPWLRFGAALGLAVDL
jgi:hypothetical protein